MAGSISASISMSYSNTVDSIIRAIAKNANGLTISTTGDKYISNTQEIATSAEAILLGDIGTPGYMIVHNLDDANFIEIGYDDTGFKPTIKLKSDEWAIFRLTQAVPQAQADTAACDMEYIIIED